MSVTTNARFNPDQLQVALPAGVSFTTAGTDPTAATAKTVTFYGCDDPTGQAALTTAAGQFVDRSANQAALVTKAQQALTTNATYLALASPSTAQNTAQIKALTRECTSLIRLLLDQLDDISGT